MGWEDVLRPGVHARFDGRDYVIVGDEKRPLGPPGIDPYRGGLSPNHKALALAEHYAADPGGWSGKVAAWFGDMNTRGHCLSEQGSSIYVGGYWTEAIASLTRSSFRSSDEGVYPRCLRWWLSEISLESLGVVSGGSSGVSYLPGCRCGDCRDGRRDQVRALLTTGRPQWSWAQQWDELYYAGARMVRDLVEAGEVSKLEPDPLYLPRLMSPMRVEIYRGGEVVLECERLDPCYNGPWWAVAIGGMGGLMDSVSWQDVVGPDNWPAARRWGERSRDIPRKVSRPREGEEPLRRFELNARSPAPPLPSLPDAWNKGPNQGTGDGGQGTSDGGGQPTDEDARPSRLSPSALFNATRWHWFLDSQGGKEIADRLRRYCNRVGGGDLEVLRRLERGHD